MDATEEEFSAFYRAHWARLNANVRALYPRFDADDVVAETMRIAWTKFGDVPESNQFAWLCGVARNVVWNRYRADRRRAAHESPVWQHGDVIRTVSDDEVVVDLRYELRAGLAELNQNDREIILLAAWSDFGPTELAVVLEVTATTAKVRLHRARSRLRQVLAAQASDDSGYVGGGGS